MSEKITKPKRTYQKHKTEKKIGVKFFLNKRLKGHNSERVNADNTTDKTYPIYIQITHRQQTLQVKSEYFTNYYDYVSENEFSNPSDILKQLIESETVKILTCLPKLSHYYESDQAKFSLATLFKEYSEKYRTGLYFRLEKALKYIVYFSQFLEQNQITEWIASGNFLVEAEKEERSFYERARLKQVHLPSRKDETTKASEILAYYDLFKNRYNVECREMFTSLTWHSKYLFEEMYFSNIKIFQSNFTLFELENGLFEKAIFDKIQSDNEVIRGFLADLTQLTK